ncbi:hypothetical protein C8Q79DRAFT_938236 [Trametes meyenii]|nr:hypothetical protein C8Q79DRAFT_938236 [Trametes meyenii]
MATYGVAFPPDAADCCESRSEQPRGRRGTFQLARPPTPRLELPRKRTRSTPPPCSARGWPSFRLGTRSEELGG